ncbi:MAG TPA: hypothetical protein VGL29_00660, partial [Blastocatellia bacterium]
IRAFFLALLFVAGAAVTFAQSDATKANATLEPTVTVSISEKGVRFAALGSIGQMRLEVFNANGDSLYNSEFRAGNVRDWGLEDKLGQPLADGSYLCVITFRNLSDKLGIKQGTVLVQSGLASLKLSDGQQIGAIEPDKSLAPVSVGNAPAVTLAAHDGTDGTLVSTRGGLSFRLGDFFGGLDRELMRLTPEGNLGIGITHPQAKLDVDGLIRTTQGIVFPDGTIQTSAATAGDPQQTPGVKLPVPSGGENRIAGKVGKGKKQVSPEFTVNEDLTVNGNIVFTPSLARDITMQNNSGGIRIFGAPTLTGTPAAAAIQFFGTGHAGFPGQAYIDSGANDAAAVIFRTAGTGGTIAERMRITAAGNIGIGTNNPQAKLDVAGDVLVSGNIAAKYQDVAEWVSATQELAAGTVVSLDVTRSNAVAASGRAYDTHIAGVVSSQPGLTLGEGGKGKVLVATTGRVKVKVDATRHAIKIGDILVTSEKPGTAMKSQPIRVGGRLIHRPGTIIGKALEPLAKGRGEILVLLSLQ